MKPVVAPKVIIIDLDGTLMDTAPDLAAATIATMADMQRSVPTIDQVRGWIGAGVDRLLHRALTGLMEGEASAKDMQAAGAFFIGHYNRMNGLETVLYPGVLEALEWWHREGIPMACVTNKPERYTLPLLEQFGLGKYFKVVFSGDSLPTKKPDPQPLLRAAEELGVEVSSCLMIGDSAADVSAALNACMPVAYVSYGYNQGRNLQELGEALEVGSFMDLESLWRQPPGCAEARALHG